MFPTYSLGENVMTEMTSVGTDFNVMVEAKTEEVATALDAWLSQMEIEV